MSTGVDGFSLGQAEFQPGLIVSWSTTLDMKDFARWTYNILQYAWSHWINLNHPLTFAHLVYQPCVKIRGKPPPKKHRLGPEGFRKHQTYPIHRNCATATLFPWCKVWTKRVPSSRRSWQRVRRTCHCQLIVIRSWRHTYIYIYIQKYAREHIYIYIWYVLIYIYIIVKLNVHCTWLILFLSSRTYIFHITWKGSGPRNIAELPM